MGLRKDKWVKRWKVPGSNGNGNWTVAVDKDGNYGCSCPRWKFKRELCHHIQLVKMGGGDNIIPYERPEYILASVNKPILDREKNRLLVPLIGIPDAHMMQATICFHLLKNGYSMGEVRELRRIPSEWTIKAIFAHIKRHGEAEYPAGWYNH